MREVYTKVIQATIAYRALAYYQLAKKLKKADGIAKKLLAKQSRCLRLVARAYKRTPIRNLETETNVPPLDIYLSKRLADFKA